MPHPLSEWLTPYLSCQKTKPKKYWPKIRPILEYGRLDFVKKAHANALYEFQRAGDRHASTRGRTVHDV
jgi:hypothetical protein